MYAIGFHLLRTFIIYNYEVNMPRDFYKFSKDKNTDNEQSQSSTQKADTSEYEKILNKYKDMNNNELMQNLFHEANKLKQEGKLDSSTINNLKSTLSPFLNKDQQDMLNSLINAIK